MEARTASNLADQRTRDLGAVDVGEMVGDVASRHPLRLQRQDRVVEASQPAVVDAWARPPARRCQRGHAPPRYASPRHRCAPSSRSYRCGELPLTVARWIACFVAEILSHLDLQRGPLGPSSSAECTSSLRTRSSLLARVLRSDSNCRQQTCTVLGRVHRCQRSSPAPRRGRTSWSPPPIPGWYPSPDGRGVSCGTAFSGQRV